MIIYIAWEIFGIQKKSKMIDKMVELPCDSRQEVEPQQFSETKLSPKRFIEKACTQAKKTIPHKKFLMSVKM